MGVLAELSVILDEPSDFIEENDKIFGMKVIEDAGESENLKPGQTVMVLTVDHNSKAVQIGTSWPMSSYYLVEMGIIVSGR